MLHSIDRIFTDDRPGVLMNLATFDLAQASAAVKSGGVVSAVLRAEEGGFYLEFETRERGLAELVTSNGRQRRVFRDPVGALKVLWELGVAEGRFALGDWNPDAPRRSWNRPDSAADMKAKHEAAAEHAAFIADVEAGLAEIRDPSQHGIDHADAMAQLEARLSAYVKTGKRKAGL
jgi:hypothetical protein